MDELAESATERIRGAVPEYAVDIPELAEMLAVGSRPSILAELIAMQRDSEPPHSFPDVDAEGARLAARFGVPIGLVTWIYRVGHQVQWEAWFRVVERHERDPETRRALLTEGSRFFFAYADAISNFVTEEYMRERDRLVVGREQRRVNLVREVLAGMDVDAGALEYVLDGRWHLGIVAWGPEAANTVTALARDLDRQPLLVGVAEAEWWAWLGGGSELPDRGRQVLERLRPPTGTRLALGTESADREGFRRTHDEAVSAQRAALATEASVTAYDEVSLEVLGARDPERALAFIARELRGLDGDDKRSRKLRETLGAYFASGQNAAATAARLGVHEQTVAQRLSAVEDRTGHSVASRRAELETALRLQRYLAVVGPPA